MKLTNNELNQVLNPFGFSDKTKAFKYFKNGENKTFKKFVQAIEETELFNYDRAEVLALILLNYNLNGSYPQFGGYLYSKGYGILNKNIEARKNGLLAFNKALKPKTYDKWLLALIAYREYVYENKIGYTKPTNLVIKPEVTVVDNGIVKVTIETKTPEYKELTIKEIENILGYKIRIVG